MRRHAFALVVLIGLQGCATSPDYAVAPGKGAGQVAVSYSTERLDHPPLSHQHANQVATRQCERLGYSYTERAVGLDQQCGRAGGDGDCAQWNVERVYQCAGNAIAAPQGQPVATITPSGRQP